MYAIQLIMCWIQARNHIHLLFQAWNKFTEWWLETWQEHYFPNKKFFSDGKQGEGTEATTLARVDTEVQWRQKENALSHENTSPCGIVTPMSLVEDGNTACLCMTLRRCCLSCSTKSNSQTNSQFSSSIFQWRAMTKLASNVSILYMLDPHQAQTRRNK